MKFGSVCSGIEAASVAWNPLGWKAAWLSEIEPFPCQVLKHHYPDVPNLGDMTTLPERIRSGEVEAPDLFCGGTPCQAFSVAGLRKSLDDARGNLSLTFCEIANAIDSVRPVRESCIVFWENVPGVLSTKDNAFGCFLAGLAGEADALVPPGGRWTNAGFIDGPQRAVAWRVLDAQYFGVAQRRRRVFVVASAREGFDPAAVLFEFDGLRRDTAPSRETGQKVARSAAFSAGNSSNARSIGYIEEGTPPLRAGASGTNQVPTCITQPYIVGNTLTARMHKGINSTLDEGQTPVIVHGTQDPCVSDIAFAQGRNNGGENVLMQPIAFQQTADCLTAAYGTNWNGNSSATNGSLFALEAVAPTLTASNDPSRSPQSTEVTQQVWSVMQATAFTGGVDYEYNGHTADEPTGPLLKGSLTGGGHPLPAISLPTMQVRRLTPIECERLQGFPDGYTAIPWRKKPASDCPDGPRYKALGNSWAVPVVRWIGERIARAT